jgi:hypothetical protein
MKIPAFEHYDYHRTIIGFHGTTSAIAERLVDGEAFKPSANDDDWLGTGVYFWEYAPRQAWWWARRFKRHRTPAVVGAMIRLGRCFDLLDPENVRLLRAFHRGMIEEWTRKGLAIPQNGNQHKNLDCAVVNSYSSLDPSLDAIRGVYVPTQSKKRAWYRSWIYEETHIQVCVRNAKNILAVWHVQSDGRYGKQRTQDDS